MRELSCVLDAWRVARPHTTWVVLAPTGLDPRHTVDPRAHETDTLEVVRGLRLRLRESPTLRSRDSLLGCVWDYDPGEQWSRKKHGWAHSFAGVKLVKGLGRVACCPSNITPKMARDLLNGGRPYFEEDDPNRAADAFPDNIFAVHDGVPYEVRATVHGKSFHGFPILPERYRLLPTSEQAWLKAQAEAQGHDISKWLKT